MIRMWAGSHRPQAFGGLLAEADWTLRLMPESEADT